MTARQRNISAWPGLAALAAGGTLLGYAFLAAPAPQFWLPPMALGLLLAGAYWVGLSGFRLGGHGLYLAAVVAAALLRFLTTEIADPGSGATGVVFLWDRPGEPSGPDSGETAAEIDYLIGPGWPDYAGRAIYVAIVGWGWIAAPAAWLLAWATWLPLARRLDLNVPLPRRRRAARGRKARRKRAVNYSLGYSFVFLGVLGLFLPILQGILFLVIGALFLGRVSPRVRLWRWRLRHRYPKWAHRYDRVEKQARAWIARRFPRMARRSPKTEGDP